MKYRDIIGFSKKRQKFVKKAITPTPPKPSITEKLSKQFGPLKEGKLNEGVEVEEIQDIADQLEDLIFDFKKTFEKSEWKRNSKIKSLVKKLIDTNSKLVDETQELS